MRHILHIFDYVFYRIHKFVLAHPKMIVSYGAPYIFSFIILLMPILLIVVPVGRMYNIHIRRYSIGGILFMTTLVALQWPIWKRYQNEENILKFERCWGNEEQEQKTVRGIAVVLLLIHNLIMIPLYLYLLIHNNII